MENFGRTDRSELFFGFESYRPSFSSRLFLCLGGFRRLSGMMRPAGGGPANSRARRRASRPAVNFFGLRLLLAIDRLPDASYHATPHATPITMCVAFLIVSTLCPGKTSFSVRIHDKLL